MDTLADDESLLESGILDSFGIIERELRDSVASTVYSGTVELNTVIISKLLGL